MNKKFLKAAVSLVLFVLTIVLVKTVDVAAVGPANTQIGLSHLNAGFHNLIGTHMFLYQATNLLGFWAILCGCIFAVIGVVQLVQRKSLAKVDKKILALGGLFVVTGILYVLFEKVVINCRPILMEGETVPEASFPSSHTVLAVVIFGSIAMILKDYLNDKKLASMLQNVCLVLMAIAVLGRLFSGVHWLTDILGGLFLSFALLQAFSGVLDMIGENPEKQEE